MSDHLGLYRMLLLVLGFYLFTSAAHTATSQTHAPAFLDLAIHRLARFHPLAMPSGAEQDPGFAYLQASEP